MCADSFLALVKTAMRLRLMPVTSAENAAARHLGTQIVMRSGSRRTSHAGDADFEMNSACRNLTPISAKNGVSL